MKCILQISGGFCPFCYSGAKGRQVYSGHFGFRQMRSQKEESVGRYVKTRPSPSSQRNGLAIIDPGVVLSPFEALFEYLSVDRYEDGSARAVATLLIFAEDGSWKACLNDRAEARSTWATGSSIEACLEALDVALKSGSADWRRSNGSARASGKR